MTSPTVLKVNLRLRLTADSIRVCNLHRRFPPLNSSMATLTLLSREVLDKQSVIVDMNVKPTSCTQGHIAQWLEHPVYNWEVLGSNPSLIIFLCGPTLSPLGHVSPLGHFPIGLLKVP